VFSGSLSARPGIGGVSGPEPVAMIAARQRSSRPSTRIRPGPSKRALAGLGIAVHGPRRRGENPHPRHPELHQRGYAGAAALLDRAHVISTGSKPQL